MRDVETTGIGMEGGVTEGACWKKKLALEVRRVVNTCMLSNIDTLDNNAYTRIVKSTQINLGSPLAKSPLTDQDPFADSHAP